MQDSISSMTLNFLRFCSIKNANIPPLVNEPSCEKTGLRVSDQVGHKPDCTATEDG